MAKDLTPDAWITSWTSDGTNISFPIASIAGLTSSEASTSTGDIRAVLFKLLDLYIATNLALPDADRPATISVTRALSSRSARYEVTLQNTPISITLPADT